eukprot:3045160-Pyramimonas_sp.AAC.1
MTNTYSQLRSSQLRTVGSFARPSFVCSLAAASPASQLGKHEQPRSDRLSSSMHPAHAPRSTD